METTEKKKPWRPQGSIWKSWPRPYMEYILWLPSGSVIYSEKQDKDIYSLFSNYPELKNKYKTRRIIAINANDKDLKNITEITIL